MRAILLALAIVLSTGAAYAGEYHYEATLVCYDCHTMHSSDTQGAWEATGGNSAYNDGRSFYIPADGTPHEYLLKGDGVNATCLNCHNGKTFAPDVFEDNTNGYVRQAGGLNSTTSSGDYEPYKGHTLGSNEEIPGGAGVENLTCISCHRQHGNIGYRNLGAGAVPGLYISYTRYHNEPTWDYATRDRTKDLWFKWQAPGGDWTIGQNLDKKYSFDSVRFNEPNPYNGKYPDFCGGCHAAFAGAPGGFAVGGTFNGSTFSGFHRHPVYGVNIGGVGDGGHSKIEQYSAGTARVHVESDSTKDYLNSSQIFALADGLTPTCFTCHKAHGNKNPFGLIFLDRSTPLANVTEEGSPGIINPNQGIRNLCGQCHVQGN